MKIPELSIEKYYSFTFEGGRGGHISVTNNGQAILVHLKYTNAELETRTFIDNENETAEAQARRHVLENIDPTAEFFEDPSDNLAIWLLRNG